MRLWRIFSRRNRHKAGNNGACSNIVAYQLVKTPLASATALRDNAARVSVCLFVAWNTYTKRDFLKD